MSTFDNATLMITGGTGSFGSTVLKHFLDSDLKEIRIFSRDEKKQDDMRHELQAKHPETAGKVKFYIGDVRNPQSIKDAMPGVDYIFHAAALKQVPSCEFFPMQAVQTNIIGTDNVLHAAIDAGVKRVVCLSTDKAAYPINAMGISKAMMEHVIYANARVAAERGGTTICCTRYGNVMCSRGSVIPLFIDQIKNGNPITITDPNMTRFLMNLDEAVDLVMFAFQHANPGDLFIQKADASTIGDLAKAVQQLFGDTGTNIIGTRHGEKLFETLMTREERLRSEDMGHYFRVAAAHHSDLFVLAQDVRHIKAVAHRAGELEGILHFELRDLFSALAHHLIQKLDGAAVRVPAVHADGPGQEGGFVCAPCTQGKELACVGCVIAVRPDHRQQADVRGNDLIAQNSGFTAGCTHEQWPPSYSHIRCKRLRQRQCPAASYRPAGCRGWS